MIYTCTLNPSIDYLVEIDQVRLGSLNRANSVRFFPGGKGINVSRVLKSLGIESTALGYLGGFTGEFIRTELSKEEIAHDFIQLNDTTRINIKLKTETETEINGHGSTIPVDKQEEMINKLSTFTKEDFVVLAGSLPPSVSPAFYERLAKYCSEQSIPFILDTSGESLEKLLQYQPFLIKPNHHELGELLGVEISSANDAIRYGQELLKCGPRNIIVSMGGKGAVFINSNMIARAIVPKGEVKSTVGAGDSSVAGFIAEFVQSGDYLKAFQYGVASGSATAFSNDLCKKEDVEKLLSNINVEIISEE
ncbi:1-phosphofructokinase [Anaerobacillus sp. MEB173]|uniref:1-phosphofructokinase n=1 Tax=Anaerobacillus sp. MEB173 TaxID=3383345 RepID=UPI003F8FBD5A